MMTAVVSRPGQSHDDSALVESLVCYVGKKAAYKESQRPWFCRPPKGMGCPAPRSHSARQLISTILLGIPRSVARSDRIERDVTGEEFPAEMGSAACSADEVSLPPFPAA